MIRQDFMKRLSGIVTQAGQASISKKQDYPIGDIFFYGIRFCFAFLLSRTVIFTEYAPFGVAFTAALGGLKGSTAAFAGAFFGYILLWGQVDGLKYAASCVLCLAASVIFKQSQGMSYKFFMPLTAAASLMSVGFVFATENGLTLNSVLLFLFEIIVVTVCTWFYREVFFSADGEKADRMRDKGKTTGMLILTVTALGSLSGTVLFDILSPARILAVLLIMAAAYGKGSGSGTVLGVASGAVMDAASGRGIFFTAIFGICALVSGTAKEKSRLLFLMLYIATNAAVSLWSTSNPLFLSGLYETFIASVLFYLVPTHILIRSRSFFAEENDEKPFDFSEKIKKYAGHRMNLAANAFQELYIAMTLGMGGLKHRNDEDVAAVFDRAADKVCYKCAAKHICWERDYVTTVGALNDMSNEMMKRGYAKKDDFPSYFSGRCLYFDQFIAATNEAVSALMQRRQYKKKLLENKSLIREQYAAINDILHSVAYDVEMGLEFHPHYSYKVKEYVKNFCTNAFVTVTSGQNGRMSIEIEAENVTGILEEKERFCNGISLILSRNFEAPEQIMVKDKMSVRMVEAEKFKASIGAGVRRRKGESVSGDSGTYFKTEEGMLYLALSDGMGSGREAALESTIAVKLIERFLRAGINAKKTVKTVAPALMLKNTESGYSTIDILGVDLFSGKAVSVKHGAASTYILSGGKIDEIVPKTLPADAVPGKIPEPQLSELPLADNSIAVMVSDGVTETSGSKWVKQMLSEFQGDDVKKLAGDILKEASRRGGGNDDMTVLVLLLKKRF